jgi:hypothetical protein
MIGNKPCYLLREENHSQHHHDCAPKQHIAEQSAPHGALSSAALLPESDAQQHDGEHQ